MIISKLSLNSDLLFIIEELKDILDIKFDSTAKALNLEKNPNSNFAIDIKYGDNSIDVTFKDRVHLIRALGIISENFKEGNFENVLQKPIFENLSCTVDCSRNAVLNLDSFKKFIRHLALMGYNSIQIYTEDTFEVKDYEYFGYFRGRYTKSEIKEIDEYAKHFGITLIPCIQTLAHFTACKEWDYFDKMKDIDDVLLVGNEETYKFIDGIIRSISEMYSSRVINIGMDEAYMLGFGNYRIKNGIRNRIDIMIEHINRVVEICSKYSFRPMMWSDMFFRIMSSDTDNHEDQIYFSDLLKNNLNSNISLIYWDYYKETQSGYSDNILMHKTITDKLWFAGGAWKWKGYLPGNQFSMVEAKKALDACEKNNIRNIILTTWGDDGAECSLFSVLPIFQMYSEKCYSNNIEYDYIAKRLYTCTKAKLDSFLNLDLPNHVLGNSAPGLVGIYPSKQIFYQDVLQGVLDKSLSNSEISLPDYYNDCSKIFMKDKMDNEDWSYIFDSAIKFCEVLSIKSDIGVKLKSAYDSKNTLLLEHYKNVILPKYLNDLESFYNTYKMQWLKENKIFGFDAIDIRIGGMIMRGKTAISRISDYLSGKIKNIEELEQERLDFSQFSFCEGSDLSLNLSWKSIATNSVI